MSRALRDRMRPTGSSISTNGHVLFSLDGARVTLYAEWTSEEAHAKARTQDVGVPLEFFDVLRHWGR